MIILCRWRNSFLYGLLFGGPTMVVMMYYLWLMTKFQPCHQQHNESVIMSNGSQLSSLVVNATEADCYQMLMIASGLSLRNLLLFIFCTPCQVSCYLCWWFAIFLVHFKRFLLLYPVQNVLLW